MKKLFSLTLALLMFAGILSAQESFEGKVKFKVTTDDDTQTIDYFVKDGSFKMEVPGEKQGSVIMKEGKLLVLMPEQKMYMETKMDFGDQFEKNMDKSDVTPENLETYKTGKTKEILGHEAEQYVYSDDENEVEVWVAKGMGTLNFFGNPMGKQSEWQKKLNEINYFPMLMISKDKNGEEESRFEVVELEEKSLSDDMFEAPSDYKKMDMMGMPKMD